MVTLFDNPGLTIMHDPATNWLHAMWRGMHDEDSAMAGCATILNKVRLTHCAKILNDSSLALNGWSELTRWIGQEFFQVLADDGVVAIAWVTAKNWRAQTDINRIMAYTTRPLVDTFDDIESAHSWLLGLVE